MTASITYLSNVGAKAEVGLHDFETTLKEVAAYQALLGEARVRAHKTVARAVREAERIEEEAALDLEEALARFHFAGGSPEDLTDLDLGSELESVVEMATTPLGDLA